MSKREEGLHSFRLFGNKTKQISIDEIVEKVTDLKKGGVEYDDILSNKEGFWGQVCTAFGIPNRRINRFRLQDAFNKKVSKSFKSSAEPRQQSPEQVQAGCVSSPIQTSEAESVEEQPLQSSPEQVQAGCVSSPLQTSEAESVEEQPLQSSSEQGNLTDEFDEDGFVRIKVPEKPVYFFIDRREWEKIKKHRGKRGFKGLQWTNIISQGLRTVHPYCSIAFKRHRLKALGSTQASPEFWCLGYCRFDDCPVTLTVTVDSVDLKATVEFQGGESIHNRMELKRRPIRAQDREQIGKDLQKQCPRTMYLEKLWNVDEDVLASGCRDEAPSPNVLKNISWEVRQKSRQHSNDIVSLQIMLDRKKNTPDEVLQKVMLHPKGVLLWSRRSIEIYQERCREDIVYLDATGSILKKEKGSPPIYVYELVVRNPKKSSSPFPVATYVTCDHTTASVTYFLEAFQTDVAKCFGRKAMRSPLMIICDGSIVLMQAICLTFVRKNLHDTINVYYRIATGKGTKEDFEVPVVHRCLSHIMKNAKAMCRKYAQNHYHLAMHTFGLLTTASTVAELDEMVQSAAVVFSSPSSGARVEKHFKNLQSWMQKTGIEVNVTTKSKSNTEDLEKIKGNNDFAKHYTRMISNAPLQKDGQPNNYFCKGLVKHIDMYLLPSAALWSGIMLGDLGRHGTGQAYLEFTKRYDLLRNLQRQNITVDNKTQGIMEKSQWDLKHIRFPSGRLTRLDDFVARYQHIHTAQLKEFEDSKRVFQKKSFQVELEKWKERRQKKRGRYTVKKIL